MRDYIKSGKLYSFVAEFLPKRDYHYIELASGNFLDFNNIEESKIELDDIAHGLAHTCRFGGQTKDYFSVCQHSLLVEAIVAEAGGTLEERMQALLHDAPEAFIGDSPTPLKDLLPVYQLIEGQLASRITELFGVDIVTLPEVVQEADEMALHIEAKRLMPEAEWAPDVDFNRGIIGVSDASGSLVSLPPFISKDHFISKYWQLKLKMDKEDGRGTTEGAKEKIIIE